MKFGKKSSDHTPVSGPLSRAPRAPQTKMSTKKKWLIAGGIILVLGAIAALTAARVLQSVAPNSNILESLVMNLPLVEKQLQGEEEGRVNIVLLGMRGAGVDGGGLLADTIMVVSVRITENEQKQKEYKASMVSIPRDLYVTIPGTNVSTKINGVYAHGEKQGKGGGVMAMKQVLEDISGQKMHYGAEVNFEGFKQIVDALGGVEITRDTEFIEPLQFHEEKVCDGANGGVFTVRSGRVQTKVNERGKVVAQYPLCYNKTEECGGVFKVPAGTSILNGDQALCYVRARVTSSDFDRAKRQQEVLGHIKNKALSMGVLTDFGKVQELMGAVSNNMYTDMELWEMQRFFDIYKDMGDNPEIAHKVLDNSEEGLLYSQEGDERGYILLPRGNSYDRIRELFATII